MFNNVYIQIFDGTTSYAPIKAKHIEENIYLIIEDELFDPTDKSCILEFIPGDNVKIGNFKTSNNQSIENKALELVSSTAPDKYYWVFLFRILNDNIHQDVNTFKQFKNEINKVHDEIINEKCWHYPKVKEWVKNALRNEET